jgi:spore germination protein KA
MMTSVGVLQQCIEEQPNSLLPGTLVTERPDRVASYLSEGHVVLLLDNNSQALVCPVTFWSLFQSAEDYNLRPWTATALRWLRSFGLLIALFLPAAYIAVINFHPDMLPTELLYFIAESREKVPFPSFVELAAMDVSFWLIIEATTRIPSAIGSTLGVIASLIIGQSVVQAKIVSPVLLIVVAVTSLSGFVLPNYVTGMGVRLLRLGLAAAAAFLGMYGLAIISFLLLIYLAQLRTLGVPFLSPLAPLTRPVNELGNMPPDFEMAIRPGYTRPVDERRQPPVVRGWDQEGFPNGEADPHEGS